MPAYGTIQGGGQLTAVSPGDTFFNFQNEVVTAAEASVPFVRAVSASFDDSGTTFQIIWQNAPGGTDTVLIQASNTDVDADYVTVYISTGRQFDLYTDVGRSKFYRAKVGAAITGGRLTVSAQR